MKKLVKMHMLELMSLSLRTPLRERFLKEALSIGKPKSFNLRISQADLDFLSARYGIDKKEIIQLKDPSCVNCNRYTR